MKKLLFLLLFIPLVSFSQDFVRLSENEINKEMAIAKKYVASEENRDLIRKVLTEKGKPKTGEGYNVYNNDKTFVLYKISSIEQDKISEENKELVEEFENEKSRNRNKLIISTILSIIFLYLSGRKFKLWIKALILFITPLISAYALVSIFNEYVDTFGGMILLAVMSIIILIYILIQFLKVSPLGTALGLYLSFKNDDDKK